MDEQPIQLETASAVVIGTSVVPASVAPPTLILWKDNGTVRAFKWLPNLQVPLPSPDPLLYREIPYIYTIGSVDPV